MKHWSEQAPATREELHFGDRRMRCFAERPGGLHAMFAEAVARNPEGEALVFGERRWTWRELDRQVARCAAGLRARGIVPGDRVALLLGNRDEFVVALYAIARLGAIAVPLNIREQKPELGFVLAHSGAALLIFEADLAERLPEPEAIPALRLRIAVGLCDGAEPFTDLLGAEELQEAAPEAEEDVAAILFTSGTTGRPKGAMLTHLGIVHSALHFQSAMGLSEADRALVAVPLTHVTGTIALTVAMARCAGTLVVMPSFKAADFLALMERERISYTLIVPAMYNLCLLQPDLGRYDLSAWRIGGFGGAPMPLPTIQRFAQLVPRLKLMNAYGATETTSPTTLMPPQYTAAHVASVGLVVACGEVKVVGTDGQPVPAGESGELWIKGPMVVKGYWQDPAATAREISDGYWHSGDIGSVDRDGFVHVFDRKKDMINRGGYKIFTAEVESVLSAHPGVIEAAVVSKPCPVLGERVHAFVAVKAETVSAKELQGFCAERLSDYKVPESYTVQTAPLPRNASGKLLKHVLRNSLRAAVT
jgi:acyl-CoA synthetase (AMP-forming)/AMP-acid ligase II